jgi:DNA repair protein RecN (Recombination protein N)
MLAELRVENLLLIERAELRLAPGLNVLTGETGAGKTVLAHALDLLLGGRARPGIVRPGASEAYVEGVFEVGDEDVVLARRVGADGRTRAYVGGRSAAVGDLRDLAAGLLSFYGQHEHRKLTLASAQLDLLDGFCGDEQLDRRAACAEAWRALRELRSERDELHERAGARERELDLLAFELDEIERVDPSAAEHGELLGRRGRLRHVDALRRAAGGGALALEPDDGDGACALLAAASGALDDVRGVDGSLDALAVRLAAALVECQDIAAELRHAGEGFDAAPGELEACEERLALLDRLARKHGGTIEAVLEHAEFCRERRDALAGAEVALEEIDARIADAQAQHNALAAALHDARAAAAGDLAGAVRERLGALQMEGASFALTLTDRESGPSGIDGAEMMIAPNPGVPAAPLRETASGGELSRVMLALLGAANAGSASTLVFDEVDAGIGGQTAHAVGEQLRELAAGRQVIAITHLPQIAALGARHFSIAKDASVEPARTTVTQLQRGDVVGEIVRMLGGHDQDVAARRHAKELLKAA